MAGRPAAGGIDRTPYDPSAYGGSGSYGAGGKVTRRSRPRNNHQQQQEQQQQQFQQQKSPPPIPGSNMKRGPYDRPDTGRHASAGPQAAARRTSATRAANQGTWTTGAGSTASRIFTGASSFLSSIFRKNSEQHLALPGPPLSSTPSDPEDDAGDSDVEAMLSEGAFSREQCHRLIKILQSKHGSSAQIRAVNGLVVDRVPRMYPEDELAREVERRIPAPAADDEFIDDIDELAQDAGSSPVDIAKAYMDKHLSPMRTLATPIRQVEFRDLSVRKNVELEPTPPFRARIATPGHTPFVRLPKLRLHEEPFTRPTPYPIRASAAYEKKRRASDELEQGRRTRHKVSVPNGPPVSTFGDRMKNFQIKMRPDKVNEMAAPVPMQSTETAMKILQTLEKLTPPKTQRLEDVMVAIREKRPEELSPSKLNEQARKSMQTVEFPEATLDQGHVPSSCIAGPSSEGLLRPLPADVKGKGVAEPPTCMLPEDRAGTSQHPGQGFRMNAAIEESNSDDDAFKPLTDTTTSLPTITKPVSEPSIVEKPSIEKGPLVEEKPPIEEPTKTQALELPQPSTKIEVPQHSTDTEQPSTKRQAFSLGDVPQPSAKIDVPSTTVQVPSVGDISLPSANITQGTQSSSSTSVEVWQSSSKPQFSLPPSTSQTPLFGELKSSAKTQVSQPLPTPLFGGMLQASQPFLFGSQFSPSLNSSAKEPEPKSSATPLTPPIATTASAATQSSSILSTVLPNAEFSFPSSISAPKPVVELTTCTEKTIIAEKSQVLAPFSVLPTLTTPTKASDTTAKPVFPSSNGSGTVASFQFGGTSSPAFDSPNGNDMMEDAEEQQHTATTQAPLFGVPQSSQPFTFATASAFGNGTQPSTQSSSSPMFQFGTSPAPPAFGSQSAPSFGSQSAPSFGSQSASSFSSFGSSVFGSSQGAPLFGSTAATAQSSSGSVFQFGQSAPVFGAAQSASSTSAPSSGSMFQFGNTQSAPSFGAPQTFGNAQTTPAFGSAPSFGSSPAFTFASTPSFGASASSFGASQSAPAFGTAQSAPPAFGTTQSFTAFGASTPAFGAQSAPAFGTPQFGVPQGAPDFGQAFGAGAPAAGGAGTPLGFAVGAGGGATTDKSGRKLFKAKRLGGAKRGK